MKWYEKVLLVPAIAIHVHPGSLVLACDSEALKRRRKHRRFVTVFLLWSETVSVINL